MQVYRAFGLTIRSEIELPELLPGEASPDLEIRFGKVPDKLRDPTAAGVCYEASSGQFLLKVDGHARYWATNGSEIVIQQDFRTARDDLRAFLLESVLGAILHQRGVLALHASAIEVRGGAAILAGPSGAGKSTLAAALAKRGHRVLSDEIAAVTIREGWPCVLPA